MAENDCDVPPVGPLVGIVTKFNWTGMIQGNGVNARGLYPPFQPASVGGTIDVTGDQGSTTLLFGGPGKNEYITVSTETFAKSAKLLLDSFCFARRVAIEIKCLPNSSFPNVISVRPAHS